VGASPEKVGAQHHHAVQLPARSNAMAESFFATLECELLDRRSFKTKTEARTALFTYIEGWYNARRRHSGLGYLSPLNFERKHQTTGPMPTPHGERGLPTVGAGVACATPPVDNPAPVLIAKPQARVETQADTCPWKRADPDRWLS
jgi:Integrase core domain